MTLKTFHSKAVVTAIPIQVSASINKTKKDNSAVKKDYLEDMSLQSNRQGHFYSGICFHQQKMTKNNSVVKTDDIDDISLQSSR